MSPTHCPQLGLHLPQQRSRPIVPLSSMSALKAWGVWVSPADEAVALPLPLPLPPSGRTQSWRGETKCCPFAQGLWGASQGTWTAAAGAACVQCSEEVRLRVFPPHSDTRPAS